ncbi:MAG: lipopolysaccharide assembly protein LapB [Gammaproteobacteria bacterium]|nr:lipopolysaccharide assembly protein LapB [Gammaproteobacteria bacterium]
MDNLLIYLLLLLAIMAGWFLGRLRFRSKSVVISRNTEDIFHDYFVGLNYLLNDEPDEAIDTFIKALEINNESVETHLALGALLRRRGKVDRAIKVHQTLLARQGQDKSLFDSTRLELALDYITAGLLDRAERLLKEILQDSKDSGEVRPKALKQLVKIYQTEKEWEKALDYIQQLLVGQQHGMDSELRSIAAHYCCELAESLLKQQQMRRAQEQIRRAFTFDRKHVRSSLILAKLEQQLGNSRAAIKELLRILRNYPVFSASVLELWNEWFEKNTQSEELETLLTEQLINTPDAIVIQHLARLVQLKHGDEESMQFLEAHFQKHPSLQCMVSLLDLHITRTDGTVGDDLSRVREQLAALLEKKYRYQCNHCGYESRKLYWLCPSCLNWDKICPVSEEKS